MKPILLARFALPLSLLTGAARAELAATFESGGAKDTRTDRLPALLVNAGEAPTPFLPAGEFGVTWTGKLVLDERLRLEFSFEGEGDATLMVDGKEVHKESGKLGAAASKSTRLNKGEHEVTITYKSKPDGSGRFRLFWKEASFPKQSVPPTAFAKVDAPLDPVRKGRLLFAENHCSKCHFDLEGTLGAAPMFQLQEQGPILAQSGGRLNEEWIARWISDPSALRPDTRMPALVDASTDEGKQQAADLAAYLMTFKAETPPAPDKALAQKGGEHFHRLGCAACHTGPQAVPSEEDAKGRVPLHNVAAKFQPGALVGFLKNPQMLYAHIGMPNFALSDEEANSIAAYVLDASSKVEQKPSGLPKGNAEKGAALAAALNCGSCHAGLPMNPMAAPSLAKTFETDWAAKGCVSGKHGGKVPKLALNDEERAALVAFSKKGSAPLSRHVPAEYASAKLEALRCTSCHGVDGKPSLLDSVHLETKDLVAHVKGEHDKVDQSRPHLTYIGEMLYSSYIESIVGGSLTAKPRPWLDMRMPAFPGYAPGLATGLAAIHGVIPGKPEPAKPDQALADIGKKLISTTEGFGCTTCHGVGPVKASAAFEVEGLNFSLTHERLRYEWYLRWLDNPVSVTPSTKMPRYAQDGKSQRPELGGDAIKQFDAIWNYIQKPD
jgi:mono/diheme cytochrome c family protein